MDHPFVSLIVILSNLLLFASTAVLAWLMRLSTRTLRRWSGVTFFSMAALLFLDLTAGALFTPGINLVFAWHVIALRALMAIAGVIFAWAVYVDLGGTPPPGRSRRKP